MEIGARLGGCLAILDPNRSIVAERRSRSRLALRYQTIDRLGFNPNPMLFRRGVVPASVILPPPDPRLLLLDVLENALSHRPTASDRKDASIRSSKERIVSVRAEQRDATSTP